MLTSNGIILCEKCHKSFHAYYGNGDNTKKQFEQWIKKPLEDLDYYIDHIKSINKLFNNFMDISINEWCKNFLIFTNYSNHKCVFTI